MPCASCHQCIDHFICAVHPPHIYYLGALPHYNQTPAPNLSMCIINLMTYWHLHPTSWHWTSVHLDHYGQPTFSSITHYSYYQEVYRYFFSSSCGLHIIPHTMKFNSGAQLLAHFLGNPLQSSPVTKLIRSSAYHPRTDGQTENLLKLCFWVGID